MYESPIITVPYPTVNIVEIHLQETSRFMLEPALSVLGPTPYYSQGYWNIGNHKSEAEGSLNPPLQFFVSGFFFSEISSLRM